MLLLAPALPPRDSPLWWTPVHPGCPCPCCRGGARRRVSHPCRAARPGAGAAPRPGPWHSRTPAASRMVHLCCREAACVRARRGAPRPTSHLQAWNRGLRQADLTFTTDGTQRRQREEGMKQQPPGQATRGWAFDSCGAAGGGPERWTPNASVLPSGTFFSLCGI